MSPPRWHGQEERLQRFRTAVPYFEQAIAKDSTFAPAWAALGRAYLLFGASRVLPWEEAEPKARRFVEKALELVFQLRSVFGTVDLYGVRDGHR